MFGRLRSMTNSTNPTHRDLILADLIQIHADCLAAAESAEDFTYRLNWQAEAKKWAARIANHVAADA